MWLSATSKSTGPREAYEDNYAGAKTKYQWDHLERQWAELQQKRRTLVGPVQSLEKDLFEDASKLLSPDQLAKGPVADPVTEMSRINFRTMWGLTVVGFLLMLGLFTRLSALGGAALLLLFYMATLAFEVALLLSGGSLNNK